MFNKILSFIVNDENKILLLHNNPVDPVHGGDFWYTVTGGVEDYDKDYGEAVIREVKEETNLDVKKILYLNWIFKYTDKNLKCIEYAYISFVNSNEVTLDESENIEYEWCDLDKFVSKIRWLSDIDTLKIVLSFGMERKVFFNTEQTEDYDYNFENINENN